MTETTKDKVTREDAQASQPASRTAGTDPNGSARFTRGPWRFVEGEFNAQADRHKIGSIEGGDYWLAEIWQDFEAETPADALDGCPPVGTARANAHLIAAAPDLYAAAVQGVADLCVLQGLIEQPATDPLAWIEAIRNRLKAALAKAEGRA